jgi:GGDEF domain-containing protein
LQDKLDIHNAKRIHRYDLSVSAGITYYDPETPLSLDDFLAQADELMYEEKRRKQNS